MCNITLRKLLLALQEFLQEKIFIKQLGLEPLQQVEMGNFDDLLEFLKTSVKLIFANININIVNISATDNSCTTKSCSHLNKFKTRVFLYGYFSFQNSSATEA